MASGFTWEDMLEVEDVNSTFNCNLFDKFKPDLKCKFYDCHEDRSIYYGFEYGGKRMFARITYEAIENNMPTSIMKDIAENVVITFDKAINLKNGE